MTELKIVPRSLEKLTDSIFYTSIRIQEGRVILFTRQNGEIVGISDNNLYYFIQDAISPDERKVLSKWTVVFEDASEFYTRLVRVIKAAMESGESTSKQRCFHLNAPVLDSTSSCPSCGKTISPSIVVLNLLEKAASFHEAVFAKGASSARSEMKAAKSEE